MADEKPMDAAMYRHIAEHQIQSDLRIREQRTEIRRLTAALENECGTSKTWKKLAKDAKVWESDEPRAQREIYRLSRQVEGLERRLSKAKETLNGMDSHDSLAVILPFVNGQDYQKWHLRAIIKSAISALGGVYKGYSWTSTTYKPDEDTEGNQALAALDAVTGTAG